MREGAREAGNGTCKISFLVILSQKHGLNVRESILEAKSHKSTAFQKKTYISLNDKIVTMTKKRYDDKIIARVAFDQTLRSCVSNQLNSRNLFQVCV